MCWADLRIIKLVGSKEHLSVLLYLNNNQFTLVYLKDQCWVLFFFLYVFTGDGGSSIHQSRPQLGDHDKLIAVDNT